MGPIPVRAAPGSPLEVPAEATATHWAECLTPVDADVLVSYEHPHFGRWPAATTRRHGSGRVTCVGTVPGRDLARTLAAWTAPKPRGGWQGLPPSVTAATGTASDGRRVHIVHNWSWEPTRVQSPVDLSDVLNDELVPSGAELHLGPWDVRVLVAEDPGTTSGA
jgi:beta-galactosidase